MPTFLKDSKPTSRGKVRCSLCNRVIQKGEQYKRITYLWDEGIYDWCKCQHCQSFLSEFDLWEACGAPDEGYTRDDLFEVEPGTWREARLIVLARQGWTVGGRLLPYPAPSPRPDTADDEGASHE